MKPWTRPEWSLIKMDAEISSYQEDPEPWNTEPLLERAGTARDDTRDARGAHTPRAAIAGE